MAGDGLPEDLIRLILMEVPYVKSLLRFKTVSRSWHDIISSPRFTAEHHTKHNPYCRRDNSALSFLVVRNPLSPDAVNFFTLLSLDQSESTNCRHLKRKNIQMPYIDCKKHQPFSTTLLCEAGFGNYCIFEFNINKVALWNPSVRELKVIPPSPFYSVIETGRTDLRQHVYGFGHVDYRDDCFYYKVGRLILRNDPEDNLFHYYSIELYSSASNGWKLFSDCYRGENGEQVGNGEWAVDGTNLNGRFHWLAWFTIRDPHIIWFDVNSEKLGRIEVPDAVLGGRQELYNISKSRITTFDSQFLCLILYWMSNEGDIYYDVCVLRERRSWIKEVTLGPIPEDMLPLRIWNSVRGMFLLDIGEGNRLQFCDFASSRVENLGIGSTDWESMTVLEHTESLVSFNGSSDETVIEN